jgi:integrase
MASISNTPDGTFRVSWREPSGAQRSRRFKTKRDAKAFKAQIEAELSRGTYVDPNLGRRILVRQHADQWSAGRNVEAATAARDESIMRTHVLPRWGDWPLAKVDHMRVQEWVAQLGRRYAPATVRECYRLLSLLMKSAVQARLIAVNPCDGVRLPPRRRKDTDGASLTREEFAGKLLPAIPDRYRALVGAAAYAGLRWGECAGLGWDVVDLAAGRLRVVRVLVEVAGHITVKPYPKSAAGRRLVPVPPVLVELLREHRDRYPGNGLVFTNTAGHPVGRASFRTRIWRPALVRAGMLGAVVQVEGGLWRARWADAAGYEQTADFPSERAAVAQVASRAAGGLRFHALRHSYATWLVSDGVPPNIVQRIMGHEDVTTTLGIYTDVPQDYLDRAAGTFVVDPLPIEPDEDPEDEGDPSEEGP